MCSIFGYVGRGNDRVSLDLISSIVRGNIGRGPHSFGLSWIDSRDRLHCFKQAGRLTDQLGILAMARDARMLIGHLRYATHGDPSENINNHPHPADGGWIVHNGVVSNYRRLVTENGLHCVSECDSESIGLMIERSKSRSLLGRCADAVESTEGGLCVLGLWSRPQSLVVARRGNPLHIADTPGGIYLGTLRQGMPSKVAAIADDSIRVFTRGESGIRCRRRALEDGQAVGGLYDDDGKYAGG